MADTPRTQSYLLGTAFPDNTSGLIDPQDMRDFVVTTAGVFDVNSQSGNSYTLVLGDAGQTIETTGAGTGTPARVTITVPTNASVAFPVGTVIQFCQIGAGQIGLGGAGGSGEGSAGSITFQPPLPMRTRAQYSTIGIRKRATDTWLVFGDLA
jgi:hypothetical protein